MRFRTWLTFSSGAATGAAAMYLLDPEHGVARRRTARRQAFQQARSGAATALVETRRRSGEIVTAARAGYQQSRPSPTDPTSGAPR